MFWDDGTLLFFGLPMPNYKRRNTQPNDMFVCRHKNVHENRKRKIMQWVLVMSDIRDSVFSSVETLIYRRSSIITSITSTSDSCWLVRVSPSQSDCVSSAGLMLPDETEEDDPTVHSSLSKL